MWLTGLINDILALKFNLKILGLGCDNPRYWDLQKGRDAEIA